jgi:hypothetical protein
MRSRSSSCRAMRIWALRMLRRCTSVGCAVSTGEIMAVSKKAASSLGVMPRSSASSIARDSVPCRGAERMRR